MSDDERHRVLTTEEPLDVYTGTVTDAIRLFPKSLNVAVALALATRLWDRAGGGARRRRAARTSVRVVRLNTICE